MKKAGVLTLQSGILTGRVELTNLFLRFDTIYIDDYSSHLMDVVLGNKPATSQDEGLLRLNELAYKNRQHYAKTFQDLDYLVGKKFIVPVKIDTLIRQNGGKPGADLQHLPHFYRLHGSSNKISLPQKSLTERLIRSLSMLLNKAGVEDTFPILSDFPAAKTGQKGTILLFILHNIPTPDDSVSWDQLEAFKRDPETMECYGRLISWATAFSRSQRSVEEAKIEYLYLYNAYCRQFEIHRINHNKKGSIEVIVPINEDKLIGTLPRGGIITNPYTILVSEMFFMDGETTLHKEFAYIYDPKAANDQ